MQISASWTSALFALAVILAPSTLAAQASDQLSDQGAESPPSLLDTELLPHSEAPQVVAVRTTMSINVDGRHTEAAWAEAPPITEFTQNDPNEGRPISEPTEVRFLYDDDAIYIGGWLYDSEPIRTRLARRDAFVSGSDAFVVLFDSYHDHQTAYRFATNPRA